MSGMGHDSYFMKRFSLLSLLCPVAACVWLSLATPARAAVETVTTAADSDPGSLRNAITAAGAGDTIVFDSALAGQTIHLASGELEINQSLTIDARGLAGGVIIDGGGNSRIMEIEDSASVTLYSLTLTNGYRTGGGGAVQLDTASCSLAASNCFFSGNSAVNDFGGAIYDNQGIMTLAGCRFSDNSASGGGGGAIYQNVGAVVLSGCTFSDDSATNGDGGAIETSSGTFAATNCVFLDNSSDLGGAIVNAADTATLDTCVFSNNVATYGVGAGGGGAIENLTVLTLNNCVLSGNTSVSGQGGGLGTGGGFATGETATLNDCIICSNSAPGGSGGGVYNDAMLVLSNCTVSANLATNGGSGGGIMNLDVLNAADSTVSGNSADDGYGGGIVNGCEMTLDNCTLAGNSANNGFGGGLFTLSATNLLNNCTISSNSASDGGYGGGIYNVGSTLAMTNTVVAGNAADNDPDVSGSYSGLANLIGGNPELAPLGNYGGPTSIMPPEFRSPVIDAGTDWVTNVLASDQRGFSRLAGAHVDIGAVEAQTAPAGDRPVLKKPLWSSDGTVVLTFTNAENADFSVLMSTSLALPLSQWTVLGQAFQYCPGGFQFDDSTATNRARFYEVVSP